MKKRYIGIAIMLIALSITPIIAIPNTDGFISVVILGKNAIKFLEPLEVSGLIVNGNITITNGSFNENCGYVYPYEENSTIWLNVSDVPDIRNDGGAWICP